MFVLKFPIALCVFYLYYARLKNLYKYCRTRIEFVIKIEFCFINIYKIYIDISEGAENNS